MPCYNPLTAYRSSIRLTSTGKPSIVFKKSQGDKDSEFKLPCNNCIGCRMDNSRSWATRLMHERTQHDLACFLTLTYNPTNLPNPPSLDKTHFQLFMKRLRKYHHYYNPEAPKIKYYMCGEYGGNTQRPHYHAIVFGLDFADKKRYKKTKRGDQLWTSEKLDELWAMGNCWIGAVSYQSAGYVARYCLKKVNGPNQHDHYTAADTRTGEILKIEKEYMAASQGLGLNHFLEHHTQMYLRDSCIVNGKETPIPKYYDRKLGELNPVLLEEIKQRRKDRALLRADDNTPERLKVREYIKKQQINLLKREIHD